MSYPAETEEYKGYTIKIYQDDEAESPRDWDNLGTMACNHRKYNLGDVQVTDEEDFLLNLVDGDVYNQHYWDNEDTGWLWKQAEKELCVILPLYLYDHSGITMRCTPFSCPWDSGQVGYTYVTKEQVRKEYNRKRITKKLRDRVEKVLRQEVQTYNDYLTGNVWGYVIEDSEGNDVGSCWGFIGDWDYVIQEAKSEIDYMTK